jgi:YD repeat-containing protein
MRRTTHHVVRVLDRSGDTRFTYDPNDARTVEEVEARFQELMKRGFVAFDVSEAPGRVMKNFDPNAKEIIVSPRFAGG